MIWIMKLDTSKFEFLYAISRAIFPIDTNINISPTSIQPIIIIKKKKIHSTISTKEWFWLTFHLNGVVWYDSSIIRAKRVVVAVIPEGVKGILVNKIHRLKKLTKTPLHAARTVKKFQSTLEIIKNCSKVSAFYVQNGNIHLLLSNISKVNRYRGNYN